MLLGEGSPTRGCGRTVVGMATVLGILGTVAIFGGVILLCNLPAILGRKPGPEGSDNAGPGGWGSL